MNYKIKCIITNSISGSNQRRSSNIDITSLILCDKYETGKVFLDCKILLIISLKIALFTEFVA